MAGARRFPLRAAGLALALGALALALIHGLLPCSFAWLTGLPCPSCGSGRAVRALVRGDLLAVFEGNPLGILAAGLLAATAVGALLVTYRDGSPAQLGTGRIGRLLGRVAAVVAIAEVVLWLVRFTGMLGGPVPV